MTKKNWWIVTVILVVLAIVSFLFLNPSKPKGVCVSGNELSSGIMQNGCEITASSEQKIMNYNSKGKPGRIIGVVLIVLAVGSAGVAVTRKPTPAEKPDKS